jgi:Rhodanese-like domain
MKCPDRFVISLCVTGILIFSGCEKPGSNPNSPTARTTPSAPVASPSVPASPEDKIPRVRAEDAMQLVKANQAVLIDVRGTSLYDQEHIEGSIDYPLDRINTKDFKGLPRDKRIIAYCT